MSHLRFYVDAWHESALAIAALEIPDEAWERDTDLPGWRVRDILAHLVHLERVLTQGEDPPEATDSAPVPADYTNEGVDALRDVPVSTLRQDFVALVAARLKDLEVLPEDGSTPPPRAPANAPWDTDTLLRNRAFDMWMHEQDIRRACDLPGNLDSLGAQLTVTVINLALPFIVGKKAKAPIGSTVRFLVTGPVPVDSTIRVGDDGRARTVTDASEPADASLTMDTEAFIVLGGGRKSPSEVEVSISGDTDLATRVLNSMTVTF